MNSNSIGKVKFNKNSPCKNKKLKKNKSKKQPVTSSFFELQRQQICDAAARIIHEDGIRDYHKAKLRACESLQLKSNSNLPTNEEIELAVQRRLNLFEPENPVEILNDKLIVATDLLEILTEFNPRLTGNLINGITLKNQPIEIHAFSNSIELLADEINWRGLNNFIIEKRYRYTNNEYINVPLLICQLENQDIEISVFKEKELHRSPICPTNGRVYNRVSLKQLQKPQTSSANLATNSTAI